MSTCFTIPLDIILCRKDIEEDNVKLLCWELTDKNKVVRMALNSFFLLVTSAL
jgi:hypothetical protein